MYLYRVKFNYRNYRLRPPLIISLRGWGEVGLGRERWEGLGEEGHLSFSLYWSSGRCLCLISDNKRYHKNDDAHSRDSTL